MHLKDLIGTDCYIECDSAEQAGLLCDRFTELGSRYSPNAFFGHNSKWVGIYNFTGVSVHQKIGHEGSDESRPRYSFSDLSDFKQSTKTN